MGVSVSVEHRGRKPNREHGVEQNLETRGSVTEVGNDVGGTLDCVVGAERKLFYEVGESWRWNET